MAGSYQPQPSFLIGARSIGNYKSFCFRQLNHLSRDFFIRLDNVEAKKSGLSSIRMRQVMNQASWIQMAMMVANNRRGSEDGVP